MAYNPSDHKVQNQPFGVGAIPLNAKSLYYDSTLFKYRPFQNVAEVNSYFANLTFRDATFDIIVNTGGTLLNGVITGGTNDAYWYKDGTANGNLVKKTNNVDVQAILDLIDALNDTISAHISDTNNPHSVTKAQLGLGNVDNTSDADKPISTDQAAALALKADIDYVDDQDSILEQEIALKANASDIFSPLIIVYADLVSNTYTNTLFANQSTSVQYYDPNGLQMALVDFDANGVTDFADAEPPFTAQPEFKGLLNGVTGSLESLTQLKIAFDSVTAPAKENLFVPADFQEGYRYNNADGVLTADPLYAALLIGVAEGTYLTVYGNGPYLNYVRFDENMVRVSSNVPTAQPDGSFVLAAPAGVHFFGITLMDDGGFSRKDSIIIQTGQTLDLSSVLLFDKIDDKDEIVLKDDLYHTGNNLINSETILFGFQRNADGTITASTQMTTDIIPVPPAGIYAVSGVAALAVRRKFAGVWGPTTRTVQPGYFTFNVADGTEELSLNLAADEAHWIDAETAMMNAGSTPLPYDEYGTKIKQELIPPPTDPIPSVFNMPIVKSIDRPEEPEEGEIIFDEDFYTQLIYVNGEWTTADGRTQYVEKVGKTHEWLFDGGSLAADGVTKSVGLVVNSESYTTDTSYQIDAGSQGTNKFGFLKFSNWGIHLLEHGMEVMEFTMDRVGAVANSTFGLAYIGETIERMVSNISGFTPTEYSLRDIAGTYTSAYQVGVVFAYTPVVGKKYRVINQFYGGGRRVTFYDIDDEDSPVLLHTLNSVFPPGSSGGYSTRPNNRSYGIAINDMGVTITKYETYCQEGYKSDIVFMGDSIASARVATAYAKGFTKLSTKFIGLGSLLHSGGSNTSEDLIISLQDTLDRKPKRVVLSIGTNDCNIPKANRFTDYSELVTALEDEGIEVILTNVIPADGSDTARWARILAFNDFILSTYGATNTVVDMFTVLVNGSGDDWNPIYRADELHPNDAGHLAMFNELKKYL